MKDYCKYEILKQNIMDVITKIENKKTPNKGKTKRVLKTKPLVKLPWDIKSIVNNNENVMLTRILKLFLKREDTSVDEQVLALRKLITDNYINCPSLLNVDIDDIASPDIPESNITILKESIDIVTKSDKCNIETGKGKRKKNKTIKKRQKKKIKKKKKRNTLKRKKKKRNTKKRKHNK